MEKGHYCFLTIFISSFTLLFSSCGKSSNQEKNFLKNSASVEVQKQEIQNLKSTMASHPRHELTSKELDQLAAAGIASEDEIKNISNLVR